MRDIYVSGSMKEIMTALLPDKGDTAEIIMAAHENGVHDAPGLCFDSVLAYRFGFIMAFTAFCENAKAFLDDADCEALIIKREDLDA